MTFSIVGYSESESKLGVAVATAMPNVGNSVPHVEPGIVAIATQANCNRFFGIKGIELSKNGISPNDVLDSLIKNDRNNDTRQIIIIDSINRKAAYTGNNTKNWSGHKIGNNFVVAGNLLTSENVLNKMCDSFIQYKGCLEEKLIVALKMGCQEGGDKRGVRSSSLIVERKNFDKNGRSYINLRVDEHEKPIIELKRLLDINSIYRNKLDKL